MGLLAGVLVGAATHQGPVVSLGYGLVSSGAALLPDIDMETSTVTAAVPFGRVLLAPVRLLCAGHRKASHSLLGAGVLLAGLLALGHLAVSPHVSVIGQRPVLALFPVAMAWLGLRGTLTIARTSTGETRPDGERKTHPVLSKRFRSRVGLAAAAFVAWLFTYQIGASAVMADTVALLGVCGYLTHLVGDIIFNGVPLLWPIPGRLRLTRLKTDSPEARGPDSFLAIASLVVALVELGIGR